MRKLASLQFACKFLSCMGRSSQLPSIFTASVSPKQSLCVLPALNFLATQHVARRSFPGHLLSRKITEKAYSR